MTPTTFLGLGANLGDRAANLQAALDALPPQVTVLETSPIYQTAPWGLTDQPDFLNQVVKAETALAPRPLLEHLKAIEEQVGRRATFRWGPRQIDIDILFYDDLILEKPGLTIPHPRLHERAFVLVPLRDVAPELEHPVFHKTVSQMIGSISTKGVEQL